MPAAQAKALGAPLPAAASPSKNYAGPAKLVVPTVRSCVPPGKSLKLTIIALDREPVRHITVRFRPLGTGGWQTISATPVARAVHAVTLPAARDDFEYYVTGETVAGEKLVWPATAPAMNQTVVVNPSHPEL